MNMPKKNFEINADELRRELARRGYAQISRPVNLNRYVNADLITDCEIIVRKDFFNILYLEASSNWKRMAAGAAKTQNGPCGVFTRYDDTRMIITILTDRLSESPKPRHLVISGANMLKKFLNMIKIAPNDTVEIVDAKFMKAFDKLSAYNDALNEFESNLSEIINATKILIDERIMKTPRYTAEAEIILKTCQDVVSDKMTMTDIRDMLIQHVMTYKIFELVYDNTKFHTTNSVARLLEKLKKLLKLPNDAVDYTTLELIAESLTETDDKQEFLKNLYATFYKKYDPVKATKDGIVYTPKQAVGFMTRSVEVLLKKHFGKTVSDCGVHVLDPATGTGTFMVEILRAITPAKLDFKYTNELHANEVYVLPYYIAALNIEHAYYELSGKKANFEGVCWTDTLDIKRGIEAFMVDDNAKRVDKQRRQPIFVVIGNPPYAVAKNRLAEWYPDLYKSIQKEWRSTDKHVKVNMDLYKVFLKWAEERINKRGVVAFISNNSFINSTGDYKMRESIYGKFNHIYIVNLKGNAYLEGDAWHREGGKIFGGQARVGVCMSFFVKTGDSDTNNLHYTEVSDCMDREEKLDWLDDHDIGNVYTVEVMPEKPAWNMHPPHPKTNWSSLLPLLPEDTSESVFSEYSLGILTSKDQWVYNINASNLEKRVKYYINVYDACIPTGVLDGKIKWTREIIKKLKKNIHVVYDKSKINVCMYRPFVKRFQYTDNVLIDWIRQAQFKAGDIAILFPNHKPSAQFGTFITNTLVNNDCLGDTRGLPLHLNDGTSSITQWGLDLFRSHYDNDSISPKDVFYYTYAILNDPKYTKKYEHDLITSFPRIPLAENFDDYKILGAKLASLHISYEDAEPYPLKRIDSGRPPKKTKLVIKDDKIIIDDATVLDGLPVAATQYMVGKKSALRWVLEFYKDSKHTLKAGNDDKYDTRDQTVADHFNTYRFEDHKDDAIDLLRRVTTVSVQTMNIKKQLKSLNWGPQPTLKFTPLKNKNKKPKWRKLGQKQLVNNQTLGEKNG